MSLLPPGIRMYFDPELSMPLGPAKVKPAPLKTDPIKSFEKGARRAVVGHHGSLPIVAVITEADCKQVKGATLKPVCETCNGTGETLIAKLYPSGHHEETIDCPDCDGPDATPSTEKPPKFKVGDMIRRTDFECTTFKREVTGYAEDGRVLYDRIDEKGHRYKDRCGAEFLELVSPSEPKEADGWVSWTGGECPLARGTYVDLRLRDGSAYKRQEVGSCEMANWLQWRECVDTPQYTISAYRMVKQQ